MSITDKTEGFFASYSKMTFDKNNLLIHHEVAEIPHVYFVHKGFVSQSIVSSTEEEMIVNIYRPNSFFPMVCTMNGLVNRYNYRAITPIVVYRAPKKNAVEFVKDNSDVLYDLSKKFGLGIEHLLMTLKYIRFEQAQNRIYRMMYLLGWRFGSHVEDGYYVIDFPFAHKDIASYTGLSRETVSRELKNLISTKHIIKKNKKLYIRKPA